MTQIEMDVARTQIRAYRAIANNIENKDIDWEQRRYEIAKAVLPTIDGRKSCHTAAQIAISYADALIEELKKPKVP